ncbi:uncharacterized protein [Montipora foliosa]|uniref:uncharacterized protein n=1 Tax=Montipora foliosa TaxID=591990 RepID=UPI0035F1E02D
MSKKPERGQRSAWEGIKGVRKGSLQGKRLEHQHSGAVDGKTRYTLLCCLLVRQGSRVLKDVFDRLIHTQDLCSALKREPVHSKLQSLRKEGILNAVQWSQLYPDEPSSVSSTNFAPSLLIVLLRTICNLSPPSSGWDVPPHSSDTSYESDIVRLKYCVNAVSAHAKEASVTDDAVFCKYKDQIQNTLVRLGGAKYKDVSHEIEKHEMGPLDEEHFKERLKQWKDDDERIKDKLNEWECQKKTSGDAVLLNEMMTTQPTSAVDGKTRYTLLCCLLVRQGSRVLKDVFDRLIRTQDLCSALKREPVHSKLQSLRKEGILNAVQWRQLYPVEPSSVSSTNFDPSLLIVLLRTICNLSPPSSGWNVPPHSSDTSYESDIVRLKYCVNAVSAHAKEASVNDDAVFCKYKDQIQNTLVRLGGAKYEDVIHEIEKHEMGPLNEEHFKERLKQWKDDDERIKDKLNEWECQKTTSGDAVVLNEMMTTQPTSELPEEVSNIHGHSEEVDVIFQAIADDNSPFAGVLVSGISGIGKSTVAIQAGHKLKKKCQSVVKFCSLRDVHQLEMEGTCKMQGEWREILNVCEPGHQRANENPRHVLLSWCRHLEYNIVLILDNVEDSIEDETRESFNDMLRDLRMCSRPKIKFLITSRRSDNVLVSDLRLKHVDLEPLGEKESIEVLKGGAKISSDNLPKIEAQLRKVAELCENIPLALRLAGPLLSSESEYDFEELIQGLENSPTETLGHGLQRMMEIAFEKLDKPLMDALVCLSVFVRSFDKKAAKAMIVDNCGNCLTKLKQRCLIQKQGHRYLIHLLIRDYARQMGKRDDFADILDHGQQRFVKHFLSLLVPNSDKFWGKDTCKESFDLFNEERINLESTLEEVRGKKIRDCRELKAVVDNCQQLASYIEFSVPFELYCGFLDGLLHFATEQGKVTNQVEILLLRHHESRKHGSTSEEFVCRAIKMHNEHRELFKKASQVFYLSHYGRHISQDCGSREKAQPILKEAISIFEEEDLGSTFDKGRILVQLGHNEKFLERHDEARKYYEEALSFRQEHYGQHLWTAFAHKDLADSYLYQEKLEEAKHHYHKAIRILKAIEVLDQKESIPLYKTFGICHQKSQNFDKSRRMFEKGIEIADSTIEGNHKWKVEIKTYLALLVHERFPEEMATAGKICADVLKMGKDLEMKQWSKKYQLQKLYRKIQGILIFFLKIFPETLFW